jgi:molecular chaperone DnaK
LKYVASAEGLLFSCDKSFADCGKYLSPDHQAFVREVLSDTRQAVAAKDIEALQASEDKLLECQKLLTDAVLAASDAMMKSLEAGDDGGMPPA